MLFHADRLRQKQIMEDSELLDEEAEAAFAAMSKRVKTQQRGWLCGERKVMARMDRESKIFQQIDKMHDDLRFYQQERETQLGLGTIIPRPKFMCGQSVLQWWAGWMKTAQTMPTRYSNKDSECKRPAWFSGEVLSFHSWGTIKYAGQEYTANLYNVY